MGIRNKVTGEFYSIATYDPSTGNVTGINTVGGTTDLGNVSNVYIGGGNPGEVLSTDGTGNLSWIPDGGGSNTGDITFNATTISAPNDENINIQALNNDGVINSGITFRPADTYTRWEQWGPQDSRSFTTADWATGEYTTQGGGTIGAVVFTDATNIINFVNSLQGAGQIYFSVNGGPLLVWNGSSASLTNITFYTPTLPDTDPTTVITFEYYYSYYTQVEIDYDAEEFNINTNNVDFILQTTNQKDIELNSSRQATLTGNGAISITNYSDAENVYITTDANDQLYQWQFGVNGNLRLPGNTFAVNYANGDPVPLGGSTGNVTFDDQIVIGTGDEFGGGGLYLAMGPTSAANLQYLRVRGGDYPTHIHLDTGNNAYYDQYFGDDNKYVKLENTGNIIIGAYQDGGPNAQWNFSYDGNVTVPGNIQAITTGFSFTSSISGINTGSPTVIVTLTDSVFSVAETGQVTITGVVGTIEADGTWYFQSIDPSNFVLYYDAELTSPVDGTTWTTYVSGGLAVAQGYGNVSITGGNVGIVTNTGNTWTFGDTGLLTLPGGAVVDSADDNFEVRQANNINFEAGSDVNVSAGGGAAQWKFGSDDILTIPGATYAPTSLNTIKGGYGFTLHPTHNTGGVGPELYISYNDGIEITPITNDYFAGGTRAAPLYIAGAGTLESGKLPGTVNIQGGQNTTDGTYANVTISTGVNRWTFDTTGNLIIPSTSGGLIKTASNASIGIVAMDNGTDNPAQLMSWNVGGGAPTSIISAYSTNATIQTNAAGSINTWQFLANAVTVFPGDLVGSGASPAPSINGFDSASFSGNVSADHFIGNGSELTDLPVAAIITNGTSNVAIPVADGAVSLNVGGSANIASFNQSNIVFTDGTNTAFTFDLAAKFLTMIDAADNQVGVAPTEIALNSNSGNSSQILPDAWLLSDAVSAGAPQVYITAGLVTTYYGGNSAPVMPTNPDHLTTKAYVDEKSYIANGTSNVSIAAADGPVLMFDGGDRVASISTERVAIGDNAGITAQNIFTVAVGYEAGKDTQGIRAVAVGFQAGADIQGANAIAIGATAAATAQGDNSIAVGSGAGSDNQGTIAIAIGLNSGVTTQGALAVAIGGGAGLNTQGNSAVAIGADSGSDTQGENAIAIGSTAGSSTQGASAIAIGVNSAGTAQGAGAIAIGQSAGQANQGGNSIAIGASAGETDQPINSIIINASGATLDGTESGLYINPVRNDTGNTTNVVYYNDTTKEVTYGPITTPSPAIGTMTSGANITPTTSVVQYNVTALAVASNVDAPTGTPADGQKLTIRILDNGTGQTLTWNAIYQVIGTTLPTTTVANKYTYVGCIYNAQDTTWDVVSVAQQA
jgi:hypothetical protein